MAREPSDKTIILPILYKITRERMIEFCALLADRVTISSDEKLHTIVLAIESAIWGGQKARELGDPLLNKFAAVGNRFAIRDLNERLNKSEEGVKLVKTEVARLFEIFWKRLDQVQGSLNTQRLIRNKPTGPLAIRVEGRYKVTVEIRYENQWTNDTTEDDLTIQVFTPDYNYPDPQGERNSLHMQLHQSHFVLGPQVVWKSAFEGDDQIFTSEELVEEALSSFIEKLGSYQPEP
jgi:hypothetical protein